MKEKVSIIIVTHNNISLTHQCLISIEKYSNYKNLEVIIIDNASTDFTQKFLFKAGKTKKYFIKKIIFNKLNLGFSKANNQGLKIATGEYIILLNNDCFVTPNWIEKLVNHIKSNEQIGIVGPVTNNIGNEAKIDLNYKNIKEMVSASKKYCDENSGKYFEIKMLAFFCVMFSRKIFETVGFLDEKFGLGFFEDDDYCERIKKINKKIICAKDVFIHHHLSASFNKMHIKKREKLFERNKNIFEKKWKKKWVPHNYNFKEENNYKFYENLYLMLRKINYLNKKYLPKPFADFNYFYSLKILSIVMPHKFKDKYLAAYILQKLREKNIINNRITNYEKIKTKNSKTSILYLSIIDFNFRFQRPQHFCCQLANKGHKIFYVGPNFYEDKKSFTLYKTKFNNLYECKLPCTLPIPNVYENYLNRLQIDIMIESLNDLFSKINSKKIIIIISFPFWVDLINPLKNLLKKNYQLKFIYDCMDLHSGFRIPNNLLIKKERLLIKKSDHVLTSSENLRKRISKITKPLLVRNGVDLSNFIKKKNSLSMFNKQINIGYIGAISTWFDLDLLRYLAQEKPNWNFLLIGAHWDIDISSLRKFSNIKFFGEIPYEELHKYFSSFNVCIIPFKINNLIKNTNPVKIYEYLATGKPCVATNIPELKFIDKDLVYISTSKKSFLKNLEKAINHEDDKYLVTKRVNFAKQNTWEQRVNSFYHIIN
jgi:GT2 family glycosyltransferase